MGDPAFFDVASPSFWGFVAIAVVAMSVAGTTAGQRWVFAVFNVGFCILVAGATATLGVVAAIALVHLTGRLHAPVWRRVAAFAAGAALAIAFLVHKLPAVDVGPAAALKPALAAIGLSYVGLRIVEYLRAAAEDGTRDVGLLDTLNYLIPFHMLVAGPVQSFADFRREPMKPEGIDRNEVLGACERIARGLFKKFVLANGLIETVFLTGFQAGGAYTLLEVQMYYLFVYLDFSAYTDIAVGVGRLLGVRTPENFNRPLAARNIIDFWERWHISLSQFIRRNLFVPIQLALMRRSGGRAALPIASAAFAVAFVLCGLWHGVSWRFVAWGAAHAGALILCNFYRSFLAGRLGASGMAVYRGRPVVRALATFMTFEFVALSLAFLVHPGLDSLD